MVSNLIITLLLQAQQGQEVPGGTWIGYGVGIWRRFGNGHLLVQN